MSAHSRIHGNIFRRSDRFSAAIFKTRGSYMFLAVATAMVLKFYSHGSTPTYLFVAGAALAAVVQALRMYAASYLWGRQAVAKIEADFLSATGSYSHVRNPLYLGNFFIGIALCLAINEWYAYTMFIISYAFVYSVVIPYEEAFLEKKFGSEYLEYKASVPRLLPKVDAYLKGTKVIPDYKAALRGEIHVPVILAAIFLAIYFLFVT